MTNTLSAAWDRHADTYGRLFAPLTGFAARAMVNMVAPRLRPDASVLDIACGTGAAAAVAVGRGWGQLADKVDVQLPGGVLQVSWPGPGAPLWQTGPTTAVYEGYIDL